MCATKIVPLAQVADLSPAVDLLQTTWPDHYGPGGGGDAMSDIKERSQGTDWPVGLAALQDGFIIGTGAVTAGPSFGSIGAEGPWLVGLAVAMKHRRRGVAHDLVAGLERLAADRGCTQLFSATQAAAGLFAQRGWQELRRITKEDGAVWGVYTVSLCGTD